MVNYWQLIHLHSFQCFHQGVKINNDGVIGEMLNYFPGGSCGKASAYNARDLGLIPGRGRSPGERNGNLLQCSCLENLTDGEAQKTTVHGVAKSWTRVSDFTFTFTLKRTRVWVTSEDLMHSIVTMVNTTVLYTSKLLRG